MAANAARTMTELGPMIFERYCNLSSLSREWSAREDGRQLIELASVRWLLGDRDRARKLVQDRLAFVKEVKRKYFPPLRSEKVDSEFFLRFLDSLE